MMRGAELASMLNAGRAGGPIRVDADDERRGASRLVYPHRRAALPAVGVDVVEQPALGDAQDAVAVVVLLGSRPAVCRDTRRR